LESKTSFSADGEFGEGPTAKVCKPCPCKNGWTPKVEIQFTNDAESADIVVSARGIWVQQNSVASDIKTAVLNYSHIVITPIDYRFGRVLDATGVSYVDKEHGIAAHEFGHMIGLEHPGFHMPFPGTKNGLVPENSVLEYSWDKKDIFGHNVNGKKELMGYGAQLPAFYFDKWKDALNNKFPGCNY
jgi:hypothetical protein